MKKFVIAMIIVLSCLPPLMAQKDADATHIRTLARDMRSLLTRLKKEVPESLKDLHDDIRRLEAKIAQLIGRSDMPAPDNQILVETIFLEWTPGGSQSTETILANLGLQPSGAKAVAPDLIEQWKKQAKVITAPKLLAIPDSEVTLETVSEQDFSYLERISGGNYVMKKTQVNDGLTLNLKVLPITVEGTSCYRFEARTRIRTIVGRTPCEPDAPTVGLPVISEQEKETTVILQSDRWFLVPLTHQNVQAASRPVIVMAVRCSRPK